MIVALCLLVAAAIAGGAVVCVVALNAQRAALEQVTALAKDQARLDADERHVLADRLQHPAIARPHRTAPAPVEVKEPPGSYQGMDLNHLTDAEILEEFGKDFLNGLS